MRNSSPLDGTSSAQMPPSSGPHLLAKPRIGRSRTDDRTGRVLASPRLPGFLLACVVLSAIFLTIGRPTLADAFAFAVLTVWGATVLTTTFTHPHAVAPRLPPPNLSWRVDAPISMLLLLVALVAVRGLLTSQPLVYWDYLGFSKGWRAGFHVWTWEGLGRVSGIDTQAWLFYPALVFSREVATNLVLVLPPFGMVLSMYMLARGIGLRPLSAAVASVIYMGSPTVHTRYLQGHTGMLLGYALLPLVFLQLLRLIDAKSVQFKLRSCAWLALTIFLTAVNQIHLAFIIFVLIGIILIANVAGRANRVQVLRSLPWLMCSLALAVLLLSPQVVTFLTIFRELAESRARSVTHIQALSQQASLVNLSRLIGEPAAGLMSAAGYYSPKIGTLLSFGIIGGASLGYLATRAQGTLPNSLALMALVGIFLSTGMYYSPAAYAWLVEHLPFFYLFRESSKFLTLSTLSLPLLVGSALQSALTPVAGASRATWLRVCLLASVASALVSVMIMSITRGDFGIRSVHQIPVLDPSYRQAGAWIDKQGGSFRVIVFPYDDYVYRTWRLVSGAPVVGLDRTALLYGSGDALRGLFALVGAARQGNALSFARLARAAGIRFAVVRHANPQDPALFTSPLGWIESAPARDLLRRAGFRLVKSFGDVLVYENEGFEGFVRTLEGDSAKRLAFADLLDDGCQGQALALSRFPIDRADDMDAAVYAGHSVYLLGHKGEHIDPSEVKAGLSRGWISSVPFEYMQEGLYAKGATTHGDAYVVTRGSAPLRVRIQIARSDRYEIWLRYYLSGPQALLSANLDNTLLGTGQPGKPDFAWTLLAQRSLLPGQHEITITNRAGLAALDVLLIIPANQARQARSSFKKCLSAWLKLPTKTAGTYAAISNEPPQVLVTADPYGTALVTISQAYHPGWAVLGDDRNLRLIRLPDFGFAAKSANHHRLRFIFRSELLMKPLLIFQFSLFFTLLTATMVMGIRARRRYGV
jgi:hypothetical protein